MKLEKIEDLRISLVINTYNRMHTLPTTLRSLESLRYQNLEVVVVDGPSTDGTLAYLQQHWQDKMKIVSCNEANLSKSRNIGLKNASGDIVCYTDDDGVPEPDWLNRLVEAYANPNVGAAGGWVRNHTGVDFQTKYIVSGRDSNSEVLIENAAQMPVCRAFDDKFPGLIGVNSSFRRTALIDVGGFDEEYAYFLDETDVLARMVDAGYLVQMVPDAEVHHKYASSHLRGANGITKSWLQIITSVSYYIVKNAPPGTELSHSMDVIVSYKNNLVRHTDWYLSQNLIDQNRHANLLSEIEQGWRQGVEDAFKYPCRQLFKDRSAVEWKDFPRPKVFKDRLRLAFVTALYPPRPGGGVAVFIHNLAKRLADLGHEITVVTQAQPDRPHTVDFEDGVWVHRLPEHDESTAPSFPESMPDMPHTQKLVAAKILKEIDRVNDRRKFQFVIGTIWDLDLAAVIASRRYLTAMYLVTSYKLMAASKPEWRSNTSFYENHVKKMISSETWALRNVDRIFASTDAILNDTQNEYSISVDRKRLTVLPFGVPKPSISIPTRDRGDSKINILFVGRFEHRKGIDLLFECLPKILADHPDVRMICIGDDKIPASDGETYTAVFNRTYRECNWFDRVEFRGHVDDSLLEQAYADCDIFVAPSRYESFGLIYLEAMRFGKACIGTSVGGIPEVVLHGETGLLSPPGVSQSLLDAIELLVTDPSLRSRLGQAGRARYLQKFTTEQFASGFEAAIRTSMQSDAGSSEQAAAPRTRSLGEAQSMSS